MVADRLLLLRRHLQNMVAAICMDRRHHRQTVELKIHILRRQLTPHLQSLHTKK